MLVDRGLLDVDENVSKYWPEFGVNGKEDIKVRHFLSHTSGISGWDDQMTIEDIYDFEKSTAKLAQQSPWWTPGTASGYQVITMGHLLGELVRRTAGKTLKQFVAEDIAGPLNADFQIGALEMDWRRIAMVVPPPGPTDLPMFEPNSIPAKSLTNPVVDANFANTSTWRQAEIGSANGHGNANAIARICSTITLGGKVDGIHLSQKTIDLIFKEQARGNDLVLGVPIRFGIGFGLVGDGDTFVDDWMPSGRVCFWGGWGGSFVIMDLDRHVTMSYTMNKMSTAALGSDLGKAYVRTTYAALRDA
jgi:CubicO group peptidase (beta-lactamase class C family)